MSDSRQADQAFEAAFSRSLRSRGGKGDGCPEPEILAAFWDRSLASDERTQWETHFAKCARCQEQLAALARLGEGEELAIETTTGFLGWRLDWRWLAPSATLAVVVLAVWAIAPRSVSDPERPVASDTEVAGRVREAPANRARNESLELRERRDAVSAPAPTAAEAQSSTGQLIRTREEAPGRQATAAADQPPVGVREKAVQRDDTAVDELARLEQDSRFGAPGASAAAADASTAAEPERFDTSAPRRLAVESPASRGAARTLIPPFADADATVVILSPNPSILWRLTRPGGIERSTDGGSTWARQLTDADAELTSGSAPSPRVCWVVGRAGVVFRTTNGQTWERVSPPVPTDLAGVQASDEQNATVTTADGTRYRTRDGGRTWNPS